jgi:hypothetical protein
MRKRHGEKLNITVPALSPTQAVDLVDWLMGAAHELELYYADEIRSQRQLARNKATGNDNAEGGCDIPF